MRTFLINSGIVFIVILATDICDVYMYFIFGTTRISPCTLQVDGFEYVCTLGGTTLPAPYNATDGSVICIILETKVRELT